MTSSGPKQAAHTKFGPISSARPQARHRRPATCEAPGGAAGVVDLGVAVGSRVAVVIGLLLLGSRPTAEYQETLPGEEGSGKTLSRRRTCPDLAPCRRHRR